MTDLSIPLDLRPEAFADFYAKLGMCVTAYQSIEDRLPFVFWVCLRGSRARAKALFTSVQGLERKQGMIDAALLDQESVFQEQWDDLRSRIKAHFDFRNKIAHAQVSIHGGGIQLSLDDMGEPVGFKRLGEPRMEARKLGKSGNWETISVAQMSEAYAAMQRTSADLNLFSQAMRSQFTPPPAASR